MSHLSLRLNCKTWRRRIQLEKIRSRWNRKSGSTTIHRLVRKRRALHHFRGQYLLRRRARNKRMPTQHRLHNKVKSHLLRNSRHGILYNMAHQILISTNNRTMIMKKRKLPINRVGLRRLRHQIMDHRNLPQIQTIKLRNRKWKLIDLLKNLKFNRTNNHHWMISD